MIRIRKPADRGHFDHGWLETYLTFSFSKYDDLRYIGFHSLRVINEDWVQPGQRRPSRNRGASPFSLSFAVIARRTIAVRLFAAMAPANWRADWTSATSTSRMTTSGGTDLNPAENAASVSPVAKALSISMSMSVTPFLRQNLVVSCPSTKRFLCLFGLTSCLDGVNCSWWLFKWN